MLTANEARQFSADNFELDRQAIEHAISTAIRDGQFSVRFNPARWPGTWAEEWLEELGYDWHILTRYLDNHIDTVREVEVSWQSAE